MKRPAGACKDCWAEYLRALDDDPFAVMPRWRPAPKPGPRCVTHDRVARTAQKARAHDRKVQRVFDLEPGEYERLYAHQGGTCAICQRATGKTKRLAVDHDHGNGQVRGLLCGPCNQLLGHGRDDLEFFQRIIDYLRMPPYVEMLWMAAGRTVPTSRVLKEMAARQTRDSFALERGENCPPNCELRDARHAHGTRLYEPLQGRTQREQLDRHSGPGSVEKQLWAVSRNWPDPSAIDTIAGQGVRPAGDDQVQVEP